jgi:hypothetical protein
MSDVDLKASLRYLNGCFAAVIEELKGKHYHYSQLQPIPKDVLYMCKFNSLVTYVHDDAEWTAEVKTRMNKSNNSITDFVICVPTSICVPAVNFTLPAVNNFAQTFFSPHSAPKSSFRSDLQLECSLEFLLHNVRLTVKFFASTPMPVFAGTTVVLKPRTLLAK